MKRIRPLLMVMPLFVAFGVAFELAGVWMHVQYYPPDVVRRVTLQVMTWMLPLPFALAFVDRVFRRRSSVGIRDAAVILAVCTATSTIAQFTWGMIAWPLRWYYWGDRAFFIFDSAPMSALRLATRRLEAPMAVTAAALIAAYVLQLRREDRDVELRQARIDARVAEARLQLLRLQLNPHFLFNALNSVVTLVRRDPARARVMLDRLAAFHQVTVQTEGRQFVSIADELHFTREYLAIEQARFGDRLEIALRVDDAALDALCPTLLLQPLVENAIKHGISRTPGKGHLAIVISRNVDVVRVVVSNNGAPPLETRTGIGLANTHQRLDQLFGDASAFRMESSDGRITVEITFPYARAEEAA